MTTFLILDDQPSWQALILSSLREQGLADAEMITCSTFDEAEAAMSVKPIDVAVLDYALARSRSAETAGKTGLDVADLIRERNPAAVLIMATVHPPQQVQEECDRLHVRLIENRQIDLAAQLELEIRDAFRD